MLQRVCVVGGAEKIRCQKHRLSATQRKIISYIHDTHTLGDILNEGGCRVGYYTDDKYDDYTQTTTDNTHA